MKMDADCGYKLIQKAIQNNQKEQLFNQWLHDPARYEVCFNEYIHQATPYRKSTEKEKEDILKKYGGMNNGTI